MKNIQNKNGLSIQYLNLSEVIDTSSFSDLAYFIVEYVDGGKKMSQILDENQFQSLSQGKSFEYDWYNAVYFMHNEGLSLIEKYGFMSLERFYEMANNQPSPIKRADLFSKNLQNYTDPNFQLVKRIENYALKFAWQDLKGYFHCEPFTLNGSPMSELHNAKYFLDEFAEDLSHRNDVAFLTYTGRWENKPSTLLFAPLTGEEQSIGGVISEMEHHIEDGESYPEETEELNLLYYPNQNNIQQLIEFHPAIHGREPENKKKDNFCVERFIINTILNGEKFLIHPPVEEEVIIRKFRH